MDFLRIKCKGIFNSFRQYDFQTYHKSYPLPLKTTIGGMLGSALGISPQKVNDEWLMNKRFYMGIIGESGGKANDLWQIRKFEKKQLDTYEKGSSDTPYKTAVIIRELLFSNSFILYLNFQDKSDFQSVSDKLKNPEWALSLGREDELIKITDSDFISLEPKTNLTYRNTVLPLDLSIVDYKIIFSENSNQNYYNNLLDEAPQIVKVPIAFSYNNDNFQRVALEFKIFSFISNLEINIQNELGYYDNDLNLAFQIF